MTRRLNQKNRVLSMNQYIHRATLGLPKNQRLDAAAELRTHLMERVAEHQAQGFSHEEAEYLAVKSMGEPQVTNRELLGHFFTHRAGWLTLAALLLGIGGWYAYRSTQWIGVRASHSIALDNTAILWRAAEPWPTGLDNRTSAEIRFPTGTQTVFWTFVYAKKTGVVSGLPGVLVPGFKIQETEAEVFWKGRFRLVAESSVTSMFNVSSG